MMKLTKTKLKRHHSSPASRGGQGRRRHHGNNQSHNSSLLLGGSGSGGNGAGDDDDGVLEVDNNNNNNNVANMINHSSNEEKEENGGRSPSPHAKNDDDVECNPIHNNKNTKSPFNLLKRRISRSKSHCVGSKNHDHSSLVLPPLEPPSTIKSVGRNFSEPSSTHVIAVSTLPVEQQCTMEQLHNEAKTKVEESLSSINNKLEQATKYIQTLPTFTLNEIKLFVNNESTNKNVAKGNYITIEEFVLNSKNNITNELQQREEFILKNEEKETNETTPTITTNNKQRYSLKTLGSSSTSTTSSSLLAAIRELYNEIYILSLLGDDDGDNNEQHFLNNMIQLKGLITIVVVDDEGYCSSSSSSSSNKKINNNNKDNNNNKEGVNNKEQGITPIIYYYNGLIIDTVIQETLDETLNSSGGRWFVRNKQLHQHHYNFFKDIMMNHNHNHNHHHEEKKKFLNERLQYCIDLISAIQYIHSKHIVHTNIQPSNIVFDIQGNIKLINFEHASFVVPLTDEDNNSITSSTEKEKESNKVKQTATSVKDTSNNGSTSTNHYYHSNIIENMSCEGLKYIAPELLLNENNTTIATTLAVDIYSMGYIVWQMIGLKHTLYADFSKEQVLTYVHEKGCRPMFDYSQQHCWTNKNIVDLLKSMWLDVPDERPTSQHVHDVLLKELNEHHHSKV